MHCIVVSTAHKILPLHWRSPKRYNFRTDALSIANFIFLSLSLPLPLISYNSFPADWFSFTFIRQWAWTRAPHHSFQPHIAISLAVTRLFKLKEEKTRTMRFNLRHQSRLIQKEIPSSYIVAIAIACWATLIGKLQIPVKHSIESVHFGFYLVAKEY